MNVYRVKITKLVKSVQMESIISALIRKDILFFPGEGNTAENYQHTDKQ